MSCVLENGEAVVDNDVLYTAKPLPFIQSTSDGKLSINPNAKDILNRIRKPLVVISIAGLYRTGKSFLMNRLFGFSGFSIGGSTEANTKGIWIWCRDHPHDDQLCLVVLDSEGLGDTEKEDGINQDVHVFALAVLLSSCVVYNSWSAIDENAIQNLSLVTQMIEFIQITNVQENEETQNTETDYFSPVFIWVVRDFSLSLKVDHMPCTADEYLEHALKDKPGARNTQRNEVRKKIRDFFPKRKCFTLKRPVIDEEKLSNLNELPEKEFRPVFIEEVHRFKKCVLTTSPIKVVNHVKILGHHFNFLAESYVNALNNGSTPNIPSIITHIIEAEFIREKDHIITEYRQNIEKQMNRPLSAQEIDELCTNLRDQAMACFENNRVLQKASNSREMSEKITEVLRELRIFYEKQNKQNSKEFCSSLMKELYEPINRRLNNEDYNAIGGYRMFLRDLSRLDKMYAGTANKGPMSDEVLYDFVTSLEGVKMLIRSGVEIISMEHRRELELQQRTDFTVVVPWIKNSLVGSVTQFTALFSEALKAVATDSNSGPSLTD